MEKHLKKVSNAVAAQSAWVGEGNREGGAAEAILPQLGKNTVIDWKIVQMGFHNGKTALTSVFRDQNTVDFFRGAGR